MQVKNRLYYAMYTYGGLCFGVFLGTLIYLLSLCLDCDYFLDKGLEDYGFGMVMNLPTKELMYFIIKRRVLQTLLIALLFKFFLQNHTSTFLCIFGGMYYGIIICDLIVKYGVGGLLYGFVCFYPHYYLYFLVLHLVGKWRYEALNNCYEYMNLKVYFIKGFVIFLLFFLSLSWEIKFQKNFLNYFFQYLV